MEQVKITNRQSQSQGKLIKEIGIERLQTLFLRGSTNTTVCLRPRPSATCFELSTIQIKIVGWTDPCTQQLISSQAHSRLYNSPDSGSITPNLDCFDSPANPHLHGLFRQQCQSHQLTGYLDSGANLTYTRVVQTPVPTSPKSGYLRLRANLTLHSIVF